MQKVPTAARKSITDVGSAQWVFTAHWLELLHKFTVDTYRARHLNVRAAFVELREVISDCRERGIDDGNVKDLAAEALSLLRQDTAAQKALSNAPRFYGALEAPFLQKGKSDLHPGFELVVQEICEILNERYRSHLLGNIRESIDVTDLDATGRSVSALVSDLLHKGYDRRHLYRRGQTLLLSGGDVDNAIGLLLGDCVSDNTTSYSVIFRIIDAPNYKVPDRLGTQAFLRSLEEPSNVTAKEFLKADESFAYATLQTEALDPMSAAQIAWGKLSRTFSLASFFQPGANFQLPGTCLVLWGDSATTADTNAEILGPLTVTKRSTFEQLERYEELLADQSVLHPSVAERLGVSLASVRDGLRADTSRQSFLHFWIGLEALTVGDTRSSISEMKQRTSTQRALRYPYRLLRDLYENMRRLGARDEQATVIQDVMRGDRPLEVVWDVLRDPSGRAELEYALAAFDPALGHRCRSVGESLKDAMSVRATLSAMAERTGWHLQRLYRTRNSIVHGGRIPPDLTQLTSHLSDFLWANLHTVLGTLGRARSVRKVDDCFRRIEFIRREQEQMLGTGSLETDAFLSPERLWPS